MWNKVLVVDDEPDLVELLSCHLKSGGYEVVRAANGLEALHQARRHLPDVILLDLMLDGMDGYSVCEILRAQPSTARIPVILVTALGGEIARLNGLESGADDFVRKPFVREEILRRVEAARERAAVRAQSEALAADPGLPGARPA